MLSEIESAVGSTIALMQTAKAAKEFFDGTQLGINVNNYHADAVVLDSFFCDDLEHSAKSIPHKDVIFKGESGAGVFMVNVISKSKSSFLYTIELEGKSYTLLVNYNWDTATKANGTLLLEGGGLPPVKSTSTIYKRCWLKSKDFRVTTFTTGSVFTITILPPLK